MKRSKTIIIRLTEREYAWLLEAESKHKDHKSGNLSDYIRKCTLEGHENQHILWKEIRTLNQQIRALRIQYDNYIRQYLLGHEENTDLRFMSKTLIAIEEMLNDFNDRMEEKYGDYKNE